jgi:hypothetical protein
VPKTVNDGFVAFHSILTPTATESSAAKSHRASIEACLRNNFDITGFFRTGSFGHATSVRGFSDVDYFAVFPTSRLTRNSDNTLRNLREVLDARFPSSGVSVRSPAVVVPFGGNAAEATEVIPADDVGRAPGGQSLYDIPDRQGGWMRSSPGAHNAYVDKIDRALAGKVKPLIRFAKAWKYHRHVPIRSFYLELRVAAYATNEKTIVYSIDVRNFLKHLQDIGLARMQDPTGVAGRVAGFATETQVADAKSKLDTAVTRAGRARDAEGAEKIADAFYWWDLVFGGQFPAYG